MPIHRLDAEKSVAGAIHSRIMPVVDSMRRSDNIADIQSGLDVLEAHLQTLARELRGELNAVANLTPSELQVATMIKNGLKKIYIKYLKQPNLPCFKQPQAKKIPLRVPFSRIISGVSALLQT